MSKLVNFLSEEFSDDSKLLEKKVKDLNEDEIKTIATLVVAAVAAIVFIRFIKDND